MTYHVYGIGAALVDTEIEVTDHELQQWQIEKGLMTLVDEARHDQLLDHLNNHLQQANRGSGGSAANTIIAVSSFGGNAFYSCKVASDESGQFYLNDLTNAGVDFHREKALPNGTTGKCLVLITPDAERSMNTFLGISETISKDDINPSAVAQSQYVYIEGYLVTSPTGKAAAIALRELAEQAGVKTAVSLSDPGIVSYFKEGLIEIIGDKVDLLFCNHDEALAWTDTDNIESATEALKQTAHSFAITLGAKGALLFDGKNTHNIAGHPVTPVDTNGAGDMFAGAFLYSLTQGESFPAAGNFASRAAAKVVSQFGPRLSAEQHKALLD